jgi:hypothetical protein
MNAAAARPFRPTDRLGAVLTVLLALNAVVSLVFGAIQVGALQVLERFRRGDPVSTGEIIDAIDRSDAISVIGLCLYVLTGIVWLLWQHRAHANLHAARVADLAFTPGWAVGWWFVPFANLVKPFQAVRELWKASAADAAWNRRRTWPVIGWWWTCWAGGAVVGTAVGFAAGFGSDHVSVESLINMDRLGLVLVIPSIATTILAIAIVRSVIRRQAGLATRASAPNELLPPRPDLPDRRFGSGL